jgi:quaternary ammonium compound-resistance protein SugE
MAWGFLLIAGIFEVVWATLLKLSDGFSKVGFSVGTIVGMIISFFFLSQATKVLPLGTAYAIWTGIGAIGATIVGVLIFNESMTLARGFFVIMLIVGIIGLKLTSGH